MNPSRKREVVEHDLNFATGPAALFALFSDRKNIWFLLSAENAEVQGPANDMLVTATYNTAPMAQDMPMLAASETVTTQMRIRLGQNPPRALMTSPGDMFQQATELVFTPLENGGTRLEGTVSYEIPQEMQEHGAGIRRVFNRGTQYTLSALAILARDPQALREAQQKFGSIFSRS